MSFRLVAEVIGYLKTPQGQWVKPTDRAVLLLVAERAHEQTREAWARTRDDGDPPKPLDRHDPRRWVLHELAGLKPGSLGDALRRLAAGGVELRVPIGKDDNNRPLYAYRGAQTTYRLPRLMPEKGAATATPFEGGALEKGLAVATQAPATATQALAVATQAPATARPQGSVPVTSVRKGDGELTTSVPARAKRARRPAADAAPSTRTRSKSTTKERSDRKPHDGARSPNEERICNWLAMNLNDDLDCGERWAFRQLVNLPAEVLAAADRRPRSQAVQDTEAYQRVAAMTGPT